MNLPVQSDPSPTEHALSRPYLIHKLYSLGYFPGQTWDQVVVISDERLQELVKKYQAFHGLIADGVVGPRTTTQLHRLRCALPDFEMRASDQVCQWPMQRVTYFTQVTLPGVTGEQADEAFDRACRQWMQVCGISLARVPQPTMANICAQSGRGRVCGLDGPGGTLAWSELPCDAQPTSQMRQMFDEDEAWNTNMAVAVICHELGHALGLPHLGKGNLMAPYYDPNVTTPRDGDVAEMVVRYGRPSQPAAPVPAPPPAAVGPVDVSGTILINGQPFVLVART